MGDGDFLDLITRHAAFARRPLLALRAEGVMVTMQFSKEPTIKTFEYLRRFCEFQIETLKETEAPGDVEYRSWFATKEAA